MKRNPLHTDDWIASLGQGYDYNRYCGTTTAIAFATIATAIANPGNKIIIEDHHPNGKEILKVTICTIIQRMNLLHMHVVQEHGRGGLLTLCFGEPTCGHLSFKRSKLKVC